MGVMVAASVGPLPVTQAPTRLQRPRRPWFPHHCHHGPAEEWVAVTHLLSCPLHPETTGGVGGSVDADRRVGTAHCLPGPSPTGWGHRQVVGSVGCQRCR